MLWTNLWLFVIAMALCACADHLKEVREEIEYLRRTRRGPWDKS